MQKIDLYLTKLVKMAIKDRFSSVHCNENYGTVIGLHQEETDFEQTFCMGVKTEFYVSRGIFWERKIERICIFINFLGD